jgi:Flp pilus assembly protein TadG
MVTAYPNKQSSRETIRVWKHMKQQSRNPSTSDTGRSARSHRDDTGAAAVEFALVLPVLLVIIFGITAFGITFNNYIQLSNGVRAVARTFQAGRGSSTPMTSATAAFSSSAPMLTGTTFTFKVNGAVCATDAACAALLTSSAVGQPASVTASSTACNLTIMGVNYAPNCTLTFTTTEIVE